MIIDTTERYFDGVVDLRLGDYREALADVETCDAVITDPPYGKRTHAGNQGMRDRFGSSNASRDLDYERWAPEDVGVFVGLWSGRCRGWVAAMTSDDLIVCFRDGYGGAGRCDFAPVVIRAPRVRLVGDGPASAAVYLMVSRPRARQFLSWGALPGWYDAGIDPAGVIGGKPIPLMRAIVKDYSRPGDLIVDPCAGGATTLIAAAIEGRRAIGAELDPETFAKAVARIKRESHRFTVHDGEQGPRWKPKQGKLFA